jgi:hypothetical protein
MINLLYPDDVLDEHLTIEFINGFLSEGRVWVEDHSGSFGFLYGNINDELRVVWF